MGKLSPDVLRILKEDAKLWKGTEAAPAMGGDKPDGPYTGKVVSLTLNTSKASGRLQVSEKWKIVTPEKYVGQYLFAHIGLRGKSKDETKIAMSFAKTRYDSVMGLDLPTDYTEMQDALNEGVTKSSDIVWKLGAKTKDNFQNIHVNGVASDGEEVETTTTEEETTGEEETTTDPPTEEETETTTDDDDYEAWKQFKKEQEKKNKKTGKK